MAALKDVSLLALIGNPERFHGQRVRVIGYARFGMEDTLLLPYREDHMAGHPTNGVWLDMDPLTPRVRQGYVIVEGSFNKDNTGHMGSCPTGAIEQIGRLEEWEALQDGFSQLHVGGILTDRHGPLTLDPQVLTKGRSAEQIRIRSSRS